MKKKLPLKPPVQIQEHGHEELRAEAPDTKLAHIVYEKILKAIVYGKLDLGEPLSENDLAKALGVSKAPIRESLSELRLKGLVEVIPQSGSYVFSPNRRQIQELCDFRSLLEECALRLSMENDAKSLVTSLKRIARQMKKAYSSADRLESNVLDTEFHQCFFHYCRNQYLTESYATIRHSIEALRYRFMNTSIYRSKVFDEHQKLVDFLAAGNTAKAISVLTDHISRTKRFQAEVSWSTGRLRRKDYKFRDYTDIFADL
ncbi:MAG: GntR family transcriptional regulator [Acidobacteriota bacterium]|nr:GntR family transcriptional regulator [Acidobacteriota bacterium]